MALRSTSKASPSPLAFDINFGGLHFAGLLLEQSRDHARINPYKLVYFKKENNQ
jgi:hypothetical protein